MYILCNMRIIPCNIKYNLLKNARPGLKTSLNHPYYTRHHLYIWDFEVIFPSAQIAQSVAHWSLNRMVREDPRSNPAAASAVDRIPPPLQWNLSKNCVISFLLIEDLNGQVPHALNLH